jgi:hypothetical protein
MLILYRYIWLVYVYFGLSADFYYPRQFSPPLPRIIESLLYCIPLHTCQHAGALPATTRTSPTPRRRTVSSKYSRYTSMSLESAYTICKQLVGRADFLRSFIWSRVLGLARFRDGSDKGAASDFVEISEGVRRQ